MHILSETKLVPGKKYEIEKQDNLKLKIISDPVDEKVRTKPQESTVFQDQAFQQISSFTGLLERFGVILFGEKGASFQRRSESDSYQFTLPMDRENLDGLFVQKSSGEYTLLLSLPETNRNDSELAQSIRQISELFPFIAEVHFTTRETIESYRGVNMFR